MNFTQRMLVKKFNHFPYPIPFVQPILLESCSLSCSKTWLLRSACSSLHKTWHWLQSQMAFKDGGQMHFLRLVYTSWSRCGIQHYSFEKYINSPPLAYIVAYLCSARYYVDIYIYIEVLQIVHGQHSRAIACCNFFQCERTKRLKTLEDFIRNV